MNVKKLEEFEKETSVLPMLVEDNDEELEEVIVCSSISGGADYIGNMPKRLELVRRLKNGEEYTMSY